MRPPPPTPALVAARRAACVLVAIFAAYPLPAPISLRAAFASAAALATALLLGCPVGVADPSTLPAGDAPCREPVRAHVDATLDGDTLDVTLLDGAEGATERVRLLGVDTPEVDHSGDPQASEWCGERAWDETDALVLLRDVYLTFDAECTDVYGRTLAYAFRADDALWLNERLIEDGWARLSPFAFAFEEDFAAKEATAQTEGRGLWGECE